MVISGVIVPRCMEPTGKITMSSNAIDAKKKKETLAKANQHQHPNFQTKDGKWCMRKCFKCGKENYAFNVLSGFCSWCGDNANE